MRSGRVYEDGRDTGIEVTQYRLLSGEPADQYRLTADGSDGHTNILPEFPTGYAAYDGSNVLARGETADEVMNKVMGGKSYTIE